MTSSTSDSFRWPRLVQLIHWSIALLFTANHFFVEGGEEFHEYFGWSILALVTLRLLYGISFAPTPARLRDLIPTPSGIREHLNDLKQRRSHGAGHNPLGAMAVWMMWLCLALAAFTGWLQDTDFGYEYGVFEWHGLLVNGLFYFAGIHLLAVLFTSWRTRQNLVKTMI